MTQQDSLDKLTYTQLIAKNKLIEREKDKLWLQQQEVFAAIRKKEFIRG